MQRTVRFSAIVATTGLLSLAILVSAACFDVAQAQSKKEERAAALACGREMRNRCNGVPALANNMLECLQKGQETISKRCTALANNIVGACDADAMRLCQGVVLAWGEGNILRCLRMARYSISSRCNSALDAAFLRWQERKLSEATRHTNAKPTTSSDGVSPTTSRR